MSKKFPRYLKVWKSLLCVIRTPSIPPLLQKLKLKIWKTVFRLDILTNSPIFILSRYINKKQKDTASASQRLAAKCECSTGNWHMINNTDAEIQFKANFTARNGAIIEADVEYKENGEPVQIGKELVNKKIHEIEWNMFPSSFSEEPLKWLSRLFSHKLVDWRKERRRDA